jgi:LDH2 family malate/lactate/ureidoglycolate dehydrogenase
LPVDSSGQPTVLVPAEKAVDLARRAFVAAGVPEGDALKAATAIADADLYGVSTHGLKNLTGYVRAVQEGRVRARPEIRVTAAAGGLCQMSGGGGLGHVAAHYGMEQAIARAREHGVGCVFMRESSHYGASGYWARLAARQGLAGFAVTNAGASMAPWGGVEPLVGNNPPAWALPSAPASRFESPLLRPTALAPDGTPEEAVFLDMALSVVAGNRLDIYRRRGQSLPEGWVLDQNGEPSTDPLARAHGGSLAPIAGYKGFGLALILSLFTSLLADGPFDDDVNRGDVPRAGRCHWFMAIDLGAIVPLETVATRAGQIAQRVRTSRPRAGVDRVYAPGDIEHEIARRQLAEGIRYERFVVDDLRALAATLDIPFDLPA